MKSKLMGYIPAPIKGRGKPTVFRQDLGHQREPLVGAGDQVPRAAEAGVVQQVRPFGGAGEALPLRVAHGARGDPVVGGLEAEVLIAPWNDLETTRRIIEGNASQLAGVILEPLQRTIPPRPGFLEGLRELTRRLGTRGFSSLILRWMSE